MFFQLFFFILLVAVFNFTICLLSARFTNQWEWEEDYCFYMKHLFQRLNLSQEHKRNGAPDLAVLRQATPPLLGLLCPSRFLLLNYVSHGAAAGGTWPPSQSLRRRVSISPTRRSEMTAGCLATPAASLAAAIDATKAGTAGPLTNPEWALGAWRRVGRAIVAAALTAAARLGRQTHPLAPAV